MKAITGLSPLETDVLKIIWPDKKIKVRQVYEKLKPNRKVALSSVAVILDRLHSKGVVDRKVENCRGGLRYVYFPTKSRKQFEKGIVEKTVNSLIERFGSNAVSYFNDRFAQNNVSMKKAERKK